MHKMIAAGAATLFVALAGIGSAAAFERHFTIETANGVLTGTRTKALLKRDLRAAAEDHHGGRRDAAPDEVLRKRCAESVDVYRQGCGAPGDRRRQEFYDYGQLTLRGGR